MSGISVGDILMKMGLDTGDFDSQLKAINQQATDTAKSFKDQFGEMGKSFTIVGGAIVATATLAVKSWADMGESILMMSLKTGMSTVALSEWKYVAEQSGTSLEALGGSIKIMQRNIGDATDATKASFKELGLDFASIQAMKPEDQFNTIMQALAGINDPTEKAALSMKVFGRSGTDLIPILADGQQGITDMKNKAHDLGVVMGTDAAKQAEAFGDALNDVKQAGLGVMGTIAQALMPVLKPLIEDIVSIVSEVRKWTDAHPALTTTLVIVGTAIGVVMAVIGGLILAMPTIITLIGGFGVALQIALGPVGWISLAIGALIAAGVLLVKNWDTIKSFFTDLWDYLQIGFAGVVKGLSYIVEGVGILVGVFDHDLGESIKNAAKTMDNWANGIETTAKAHKDLHDSEQATTAATKEAASATQAQTTILGTNTASLNTNTAATQSLKDAIDSTTKSVQAESDALNYSRTAAGQAGITEKNLEDVMLSMGFTVKDTAEFIGTQTAQGKNLNDMLILLGWSTKQFQQAEIDLAVPSDALTASIKAQTDAMKAQVDQINAVNHALYAAANSIPGGGVVSQGSAVSNTDINECIADINGGMSLQTVRAKYGAGAVAAALGRISGGGTGSATPTNPGGEQWGYPGLPTGSGAYTGPDTAAIIYSLGLQVPGYAAGGQVVANKPTLALFGEAGPELASFTPLKGLSGSMTGGGTGMTIIFNGAVLRENFDIDAIGEKIANSIRLRTGLKI